MLALLLSSAASLFLFTGFGFITTHLLRVPAGAAEKALVGMVAVNTITAWLSLFLPVNGYLLLAMTSVCGVCIFFMRKRILSLFVLSKRRRFVALCSLPFMVTALLISVGSPGNYDTGLYHWQAIRWTENYPAVPGLANLHGRFGFNPNVFTLSAITSLSGVFGQEIFSLNFTLFAVLAVYFVNRLYILFSERGLCERFIFYATAFVTLLGLSGNLSSPSPDFPATALTLFIFARTLDYAGEHNGVAASLRSYVPVLLLSVYLLTIKLSTAPVLLLALWMARKQKPKLKTVLTAGILAGFVILPWLLRNVILSGWLVYPFPSLDVFAVDWKVPLDKVIAEKEAVTGWARSPGKGYVDAARMNLFQWMPHWWRQQTASHQIWVTAALCFPVISFATNAMRKRKSDFFITAVVLTSFSGVLFWVCTAPDFRFGEAFIIVAAASPLLYAKFRFRFFYHQASAFIFFLLLLAGAYAKWNRIDTIEPLAYKLKHQLTRPQRNEGTGIGFTSYKMDTVTVYVPAKGDQCFDHCLPCTPYLYHKLRLRGITVASGFKQLP